MVLNTREDYLMCKNATSASHDAKKIKFTALSSEEPFTDVALQLCVYYQVLQIDHTQLNAWLLCYLLPNVLCGII